MRIKDDFFFFIWIIRAMNKYSEKQRKILLAIKNKIGETEFEDVDWPNEENIRNWIWVGDESGLIGNDNCHYEFIFQKEYTEKLSLEVHLDERKNHKLFSNMLLPDFLRFDKWNYKNGRIVYKDEAIDINNEQIVSRSIKLLKKLHNAIGEQLLEIMQSHPELLPKPSQKPVLLVDSRNVVTKRKFKPRIISESKVFNSKHGEIQNRLEKELKQTKMYESINKENGFENRSYQIDVLAQKKNGHYDIFEVKPYPTATECIREALGQLFFYKFLLEKGGYEVDTLYIVGPSELSDFEDEFLQSIKNDLKKSKIKYYPVSLD